jgi:YfiH family protein
MIISAPSYSIFFGDRPCEVAPDNVRAKVLEGRDLSVPIERIIFQHQVHGTTGNIVLHATLPTLEKSLTHDGDYLITALNGIGIGVLTADCLPIALADPVNRVVAIVHAGWRGTVGGIVCNVLADLQKNFGTNPRDLLVYYGPCAHTCCYHVDEPFLAQLPDWARSAVIERDGRRYFDLCGANALMLESCGVRSERIDCSSSSCTICNENFCSYRRNPGITTRQMSIIWLH